MRFPRWAVLAFVVLVFAGTITGVTWRSSAAKEVRPPKRAQAVQSGPRITTISLTMATAYKPKAPPGATDDYHCTLMNPHVAHNSYIISSQFFPGSIEDHHAILFLVPAALAAQAERDNVDGKGWTCFGEAPLPNTSLAQISNTPWLSAQDTGPTTCRKERGSCCRQEAW
jgi:hypothetical protein